MKRLLILVMVVCGIATAHAQQDPSYSLYMFNQQFINPAYAGTHEQANATVLSRKMWVGFGGSPFTNFISVDAPLKLINSGVGLTAYHDRIGVVNTTSAQLNYSYHIPLASGHLSFGLRGGATYYVADLTDVQLTDQNDPTYSSNLNTLSPNFGTGVYYYSDRLYIGASAPHLINYEDNSAFNASGVQDDFERVRHYFLNGGYAISVSDNLMLRPSAMLRYVNNAPLQADINLNALLADVVWLGLSYRTNNTGVALAAVQITPAFKVGYSYDFPFTALDRTTYGSHELMLSLDFGKKKTKVKTPRYF